MEYATEEFPLMKFQSYGSFKAITFLLFIQQYPNPDTIPYPGVVFTISSAAY